MSTVKYMLIAARYVEATEPEHVAASRLGPIAAESSDASDEQVSALPSYAAVARLAGDPLGSRDLEVPAAPGDRGRRAGRLRAMEARRAGLPGVGTARQPPVSPGLRPAVAMLDWGHGIKTTARSLGVSVSTLRRRIREAGDWPRPAEAPEAAGAPTA